MFFSKASRIFAIGLMAAPASVFPMGPVLQDTANAQPVRVLRADGSGSFGHGYVFGDRATGDCRIVLPAHVIRTIDGRLSSASLTGLDGTGGAAQGFTQPDADIDIAFGRVEGLGGECLSRLPAQPISDSLQAGTTARLTFSDTAGGGTRTMPVRIRDQGLNGHFSIEPIASSADENPRILPGFSGSLVDKLGGAALGGDLPLGLVVNVCDGSSRTEAALDSVFSDAPSVVACGDGHYATVVGFDIIRELSNRAPTVGAKSESKTDDWHIVGYEADVVSGTSATLAGGDGCFLVKPRSGDSAISLDFNLLGEGALTAITLEFCEDPLAQKTVSVGSADRTYRTVNASDRSVQFTVGRRPRIQTWVSITPETTDATVGLRQITFHGDQ